MGEQDFDSCQLQTKLTANGRITRWWDNNDTELKRRCGRENTSPVSAFEAHNLPSRGSLALIGAAFSGGSSQDARFKAASCNMIV